MLIASLVRFRAHSLFRVSEGIALPVLYTEIIDLTNSPVDVVLLSLSAMGPATSIGHCSVALGDM